MGRIVVQFGSFRANLDSGELYRDGIRLKLGGQPFQVLATLVSRPGELVTREELRTALWRSETFVDFDQGLNTAINKLREALRDTASNPRFVETVPRRGYRFIAPVTVLAEHTASANGNGAVPEAPTPRAKVLPAPPAQRVGWMKIVAAVVLAAAVSAWVLVPRAPAPPVPPVPTVPITALPGAEFGASFSPDGKQVTFYWEQADSSKSGIYLRSLDSDKVTPLVVEERSVNYNPAWSPDGQTIAFLRRTADAETWVHLIAPAGGPDRRLIRLTASFQLLLNTQHLSWGPDSQWLLAPMAPGGEYLTIHRISLNGEAQPVIAPGVSSFAASVSPDGRAFAFHGRTGKRPAASEIFVQRLSRAGLPQGQPQWIGRAEGLAVALAWMPNGEAVLSCAEHGGVGLRMFRVPVPAGEVTPINAEDCRSIAISRPDPSGEAMLLYGTSSIDGRSKMWRARLDNLAAAAEFSPSSRPDAYPVFSPGGESVAFVSSRSGQSEIWVARVEGGEAARITNNAQARNRPNWSPDGNHLAFATLNTGQPGTMIVPIAGGAAKEVLSGGQRASSPMWSRDGRFIYYSAGEELWRARPDGSEAAKLIDGNRYFPVAESPDGRSVYCLRRGNPYTLYRIPSNGGAAELIEQGIAEFAATATRTALYFVRDVDRGLYRLPFQGGRAQKLGVLRPPTGGAKQDLYGITVSPDDATIVWATTAREIDLALIRGFR